MPADHQPGEGCALSRFFAICMVLGLCNFGIPYGMAQQLQTTAQIGLTATLSDNVNLSSGSNKEADFYTIISPSIGMTYDGPRLTFTGTYSPSAVVYANNSDFNSLYNSLSAAGTLTAIDNFFYIDASASISQQYLSGFAPVPIDLGNITGNRVETRMYGLSPYFKGTTDSGVSYELRNRNGWVDTNTSVASNSYFQEWLALADKTVGLYSMGADFDRQETSYPGQNKLITKLGRLRLGYQVSPELRLTARGGYEMNNYFVGNQSGVIYGAGVDATPTPRTTVSGYWEHHFYGDSYSLAASHRRRRSAFTLSASQGLSTYPQALFSLPPGNTASLLDAALTAQIPDPVQRQAAVNQIAQQAGLPPFLLNPFTYFSNTVFFMKQVNASAALLGARNSIVFSVFWGNSENVGQPGITLPGALALNSNFTSTGGAVDYTYKLSPKSTVDALLTRTYTHANVQPSFDTTQDLLRLMIMTQLDVKTTGGVGVRAQRIVSTGIPDVIEHAIFATLNHTF